DLHGVPSGDRWPGQLASGADQEGPPGLDGEEADRMDPDSLPAPSRPLSPPAAHQSPGTERLRHVSWRSAADAPGLQGEQRGSDGVLHYLPYGAEGVAGLHGMSLLTARGAVILTAAKDPFASGEILRVAQDDNSGS